MYSLTIGHVVGIILTLVLITAVGIYSGRKVKNVQDFSVGGKRASSPIVAGTIMGTLVGGSATIGTAQLAFVYGFSAWWFTLGAGIGCLMLVAFSKRLYNTNKETIPQVLEGRFGTGIRTVSGISISIGMLLNIVAQVLSAIALFTSIFKMNPLTAAIITVVLMAVYVIFGGVWGTGFVGILKLCLIYTVVIVGGVIALNGGGGLSNYISVFPSNPYFSLFGRGILIDAGSGLSLIVGVISTQTYVQAMLSGKDLKEARKGGLISAILIPPIGIAGIFIGLYMKMNYPNMDPSSVLPAFIMINLNPIFAGIALATLLIAVVGTGAGLALGISTIFTRDIYKNYINKNADSHKMLLVTRIVIICMLLISLIFITGNMKTLILQWGFMSMGLRGAAVFVPLCAALFVKRNINNKIILCSMIFGPMFVLLGKYILPQSLDPLFLGIAVSVAFIVGGYLISFKNVTSKEEAM